MKKAPAKGGMVGVRLQSSIPAGYEIVMFPPDFPARVEGTLVPLSDVSNGTSVDVPWRSHWCRGEVAHEIDYEFRVVVTTRERGEQIVADIKRMLSKLYGNDDLSVEPVVATKGKSVSLKKTG